MNNHSYGAFDGVVENKRVGCRTRGLHATTGSLTEHHDEALAPSRGQSSHVVEYPFICKCWIENGGQMVESLAMRSLGNRGSR